MSLKKTALDLRDRAFDLFLEKYMDSQILPDSSVAYALKPGVIKAEYDSNYDFCENTNRNKFTALLAADHDDPGYADIIKDLENMIELLKTT